MIKADKLKDLEGNKMYSLKGLCMALLWWPVRTMN